MKDRLYEDIIYYKKHGKWPQSLQGHGKEQKRKLENKKKDLKREAKKYVLQNDNLFIEKSKIEKEVTIIDEEKANQKLQTDQSLVEDEDYSVNEKRVSYYFKVIPEKDHEYYLSLYHEGNSDNPGGHWGRDRMVAAMRNDGIYFNGQWKKSVDHVKKCETCTRDDVTHHCEEPLQGIVEESPHQRLQLDLVDFGENRRDKHGRRYLLTAVDCHSIFIWVRPLHSKNSSEVSYNLIDIIKTEG